MTCEFFEERVNDDEDAAATLVLQQYTAIIITASRLSVKYLNKVTETSKERRQKGLGSLVRGRPYPAVLGI